MIQAERTREPEGRAGPGTTRRPVLALLGLAALAALAFRRMLLWDPSLPGLPDVGWFVFGVDETAPQVVLAAFAFLLYGRRARLARALAGRGAPLRALPFLGAGLGLFLWAHYVDAPDLLVLAFLPFFLGSALLLCGVRFARELALPLLFLAFAIPMPGVLSNQIVFPLQLWNAEQVGRLLPRAGFPLVQEGDVLYVADGSVEVIETCSGLRSMIVLTMLAVGFVCYFPARRLHAALLIAATPVIACLMNAARIVVLVLDPGSDVAESHALQGGLLFLGGAAGVYAVDAVLERWLGARGGATEPAQPAAAAGPTGRPLRIAHAIALAALLSAMLAASLWLPRWSPSGSQDPAPIDLPPEMGGWQAVETLEPDWQYLGSVGLPRHVYRRYQRAGETVSVFVGYDDRLSRSRALISPKHAFPGRGWDTEERSVVALGAGGLAAEALAARSRASRMLSYHWYQGVEGLGTEVLRAWLAADRSCLRRPGGARVIRLDTEIASESRSRAEARLREVSELVLARLSDPGGG